MNPYEQLAVSRPATDLEIRKAYLNLIRQFSPERDPEKFKALREAYESIKDANSRMKFLIFQQSTVDSAQSPMAVFHEFCGNFPKEQIRLAPGPMKEYLKLCSKKIYSKK